MAKLPNIVINAASVAKVLQNHEAVSQQKVQEVTSDPVEQARLVAGLNNALVEIADHEDDPDVLSSPPSGLASQLQTFLAQKAEEEDKPIERELAGGGVEARFDSKDWLGWAKSFFTWVGRDEFAKWLTAPANPEPLLEKSRFALFADWGTGLYGAPPSARCIENVKPAVTHVIHLGDVYYSGTTREIDDSFSKLKELPLETFEKASPGKSVLYILAGEQDASQPPVWATGVEPKWSQMHAVANVDALFEQKYEFTPGQLLVTYGFAGQTVSVQTYGLPNRATFLTLANQAGKTRQIQQFILPIHSLFARISKKEREYLEATRPLPRVRYMSTAQRLFALQSPIEGRSYKQSDHFWVDLLHHKWLDPIMALIACYELIRRGKAKDQQKLMKEVLSNMRIYFAGIPDTEIIAELLGEPNKLSETPPLLLDGLLALGKREGLPLSAANLDFNGIWTTWKNALMLPGHEARRGSRAPLKVR